MRPSDPSLALFPADLRAGDILLYRPISPKFHQRHIIKVTGSPYTHAAIYLGGMGFAEANFPFGVNIKPSCRVSSPKDYVAVLRTQMRFDGDRPDRLLKFARSTARRRLYNAWAAVSYGCRRREYFEDQLEILRAHSGAAATPLDYSRRRYFCSSFVVACYAAVGLIGGTAQPAYPESVFAPGDLYLDPTFGWLLGYISPLGVPLPDDDPIFARAVLWPEILALDPTEKWW